MDTLKVENFGPIKEANVEFGDFTLLVGPQATGKSILLQLFKLMRDKEAIAYNLKEFGYLWDTNQEFIGLYFGEGMQNIWNEKTEVVYNGVQKILARVFDETAKYHREEKVFYAPAQRVLTLQYGWPRAFREYGSDPYVLKGFSELLRSYMEIGPGPKLFQDDIRQRGRDEIYKNVFYEGEIELDKLQSRRRFILKINNNKLPFMMWSAGQREFMPLWLLWYLVAHKKTLPNPETYTIIIEEPEMGLHPKAIVEIIRELLALISSGYKVIISTHSPIFIEFAWAIKFLKDSHAKADAIFELFEEEYSEKWAKRFDNILQNKEFRTYYFDNKSGTSIVKDISSLDAFSEDDHISEWGGLSSFATRASEVVSKNVSL